MRNRIVLTVCLGVLLATLAGCRVNNGDIGPLYGVWAVTEVEVDGETYDGWKSEDTESFFQFQNNIIFVSRVVNRYVLYQNYGTWEWLVEDNEISLNFLHHDNNNPEPGSGFYAPPEWLLLTEPGVYNFDVTWQGEKRMIWSTINTQGLRLTYHLKKTY